MHELSIEGVVGWDVTSSSVRDSLRGKSGPLTVFVNSVGGDVFDGVSIFNQLQRHDGPVSVIVDGLAASAASFVAMAAESVTMATGSEMMVHLPWSVFMGDRTDIPLWDKMLRDAESSILDAYAARVSDREQMAAWLEAETWFTAAEAVEAGLADSMDEQRAAAKSVVVPQGLYHNTPERFASADADADKVLANVVEAIVKGQRNAVGSIEYQDADGNSRKLGGKSDTLWKTAAAQVKARILQARR